MKKDQAEQNEKPRKNARFDFSKIKRALGRVIAAFGIIMKNRIVISCCLLFQGFFWVFNPKGSLEWDIMFLSVLSLLYGVAGLIVQSTGGNEIAVKGQKKFGELYRGTLDDKKDQFVEPARQSDITVLKERGDDFLKDEKKVKEFSKEAKKKISTKKKLLIACYVILIIVSIAFIVFKSFFSGVVFVILGWLITIEGALSILTWWKTKDSVKPLDRNISLAIAIFSVLLGVILFFFPIFTGPLVIRLLGIGILVKAVADLVIGFRNRTLIPDTQETISKIKNI